MKLSSGAAVLFLAVASSTSAKILHVVPGALEARGIKASHHSTDHAGFHRRAPSNEAQMAANHGPSQCTASGSPETDQMQQKKEYPTQWELATISSSDSQAQKVWQDIQNSGIIPSSVKVKPSQGNAQMSPDTSGYDDNKDPDCWWSASTCKTPKAQALTKFPDIYSCPEPNTWGLTFDDGPNCTHNAFYDFLKQNKLKATMFYIGSNVLGWPYQAQRGLADGHDICVHTWSHHAMTTLNNEQAFAELYYAAKIIKQVIGITPTCWRPPFGDVDDRIRAIAYGLGLRTILWEEDTDDWNIIPGGAASTQKIDQNYQNIINKAGSESPVVLTHEINKQTMNEFQKQFPNIRKAYKNVVPITACQNISKPYADSDISYPGFSDFVSGKGKPRGLPNGQSMKIDPSATFNPTRLNKQANGFTHQHTTTSHNATTVSSTSSKRSTGLSSSTETGSSSMSSGNTEASASQEKSSGVALSGVHSLVAALCATLLSLASFL